MAGSPKHLRTEAATEEVPEERQVYLRDGRTLTVSELGADQLVEIRNPSGLLEVRIALTEQGPVLQMEAVKLQLKASETVEIAANRVEIQGNEQLDLKGKAVQVHADEEVHVDAAGDVRVTGKVIWLN